MEGITRKCVFAGTFDPPTLGHKALIEECVKLFDEVVVAIMVNPAKRPYLPVDVRVKSMEAATKHLGNVRILAGSGATVELARQVGAQVMVRGLRSVTDFEYESTLAAGYRYMAPEIETVFMLSKPEYGYISSSLVRDIHALGGDITALVPQEILRTLAEQVTSKGE